MSHAKLNLFYGEEFLVREAARNFIDGVLPESVRDTNLIVFDGAGVRLADVIEEVYTQSLFGGHKLILIEQTTLFLSGSDNPKLLKKAVDAWKAGSKRSALRSFGACLSMSGAKLSIDMTASELISDSGLSARGSGAEILLELAGAFIQQGSKIPAQNDEQALDNLITGNIPDDITILFTALEVNTRQKSFKLFQKYGNVAHLAAKQERFGPALDKDFFNNHVKDILRAAGKEITPSALDKMRSLSGLGMRSLQSELDKLIAYIGERKKISDKDVEELFLDSSQSSYFDFIDALHSGDLQKTIIQVNENLKTVEHPLIVLGSIAAEFRKLIIARELLFTVFAKDWKPSISYKAFQEIVSRAKRSHPELFNQKNKVLNMHEFPLFKLLRAAQKIPLEKLVRIMESILEADIALKSTKLASKSPNIILENLIIQICSK